MVDFTFEVEGLRELERQLLDIANETKPSAAAGLLVTPLRKAAAVVEDEIRRNTPVDTGTLRDSIGITVRAPTKTQIRFGTAQPDTVRTARVGYKWRGGSLGHVARAIEYGTAFRPAQAPLRRSIESTSREVVTVFREELALAIERRLRRTRGRRSR